MNIQTTIANDTEADPIDIHVGSRIRLRRATIAQTQQELASDLGCSFQQVQKYERGQNRVSASALYRVAVSQGVGVGFYFEGLEAWPMQPINSETQNVMNWAKGPDAYRMGKLVLRMPEVAQKALWRIAEALVEAFDR